MVVLPAMPLTQLALKQNRPQFQNASGYLPNGNPGATPLIPNAGRVIQSGQTRVLCVADVRGKSLTSHFDARERASQKRSRVS